jgi:uncharacterized protein
LCMVRFRLFALSLSLSLCTLAQPNKQNDLALLVNGPGQNALDEKTSLNSKKPLDYKRKNAFLRYNPITLTLTGTMLLYQHVVSPQLGTDCLYERSCSNFAKASISEIGVIRGVFIAADRLFRCNMAAFSETPLIYFNENGKIIDEPSKYKFH